MPRQPAKTDFRITVEGIGDFVFARRKMRDEVAAQVEYARLIDGVEPTQWLVTICGALADLMVLTVKAPEGWDLDEMEPHDPETYNKLIKVHAALRTKELSFRPGAGAGSQAAGAGAGEDDRVPVSA